MSLDDEVIILEGDNSNDIKKGLVSEFSSITSADQRTAEFFLETNSWNLQAGIDSYFASAETDRTNSDLSQNPAKRARTDAYDHNSSGQSSFSSTADSDQMESDVFRIASWNIDGLDDEGFSTRAMAVASEIKEKQPDVIFLQEVVNENLEILFPQLDSLYDFKTSGTADYYTAILLRKATMLFKNESVEKFPGTRMGRNLFSVKANFGSIPLHLFTAHLESTKDSHAVSERKAQLKTSFDRMTTSDPDLAVIFGGDLNLRDNELKEIGGIPKSIVDLYTVTGSRKECASTWDTTRNTNAIAKIGRPASSRPIICRFDRLYFRPSATNCSLIPVHFNLIGLKKAPSSRFFPSDHWGIMVTFDRKS